jgi:hypothetical protein
MPALSLRSRTILARQNSVQDVSDLRGSDFNSLPDSRHSAYSGSWTLWQSFAGAAGTNVKNWQSHVWEVYPAG